MKERMNESVVQSCVEVVVDSAEKSKIRVLHVDDEPDLLKVAKQCLELQGPFQVDTAGSVEEALAKLEKERYDAVVSDFQMPGKDGLEFLEMLRKNGNTIPFIIFTGKGREEVALRAWSLGGDHYINKTGDPETVYCELAHCLRTSVEKHIAKARAEETIEKFEGLFRHNPEAAVYLDANFKIVDMNPRFSQLFGYSSEEAKGKNINDVVVPEDIREEAERLDKDAKNGYASHDTVRKRKDGSLVPVSISAAPVTFENNLLGYVSIYKDITDLKEIDECLKETNRKFEITNEKLQESETKFRTYVENSPVAVFVTNSEGKCEYVNEAASKLLGYSAKELLRMSIPLVVFKEEHLTSNNFAILQETGNILVEVRLKKKDGQAVYVSLNAVKLPDGKSLAFCQNITERKKMEDASKESEGRLRSIVENSSDQIFMLDRDCRFLSVNKTGADLFRKSPQEMIGRSMSEVFPETIAAQFSKNIKNVFDNGKSTRIDEKMVVEGRELYSSTSLNPVKDDSGRVIAVTGIVRDITERKKVEKTLQESEERFRAIFEGANDGILAADAKTRRFSFANPRMCEITGYSLEELLKLGVGDINPKKDLPYVIDSFEKQRQGKVALSKDIPVLRKDGRVVYCDVNSKSLKIGSQEYLVGIFRDVTETKKAKEKLRQNSDRIEMMNEKLRVVGGLTRHDVRNKLSTVTGNAYLLKRKLAGNPEALEQLADMETAVRLVVKIFEFARTYEKLGVEQLVNMDVGKAVDGAVSLFSGLKSVKIVNECGGLTVLADSLLSQLFYNLIDNSLKYGEKTQQIRVYYKTVSADKLELVYEDDGVGIPDNMRSNLFKEGFTSGKGTGYGLFMINRICDVYGWTIQEVGTRGGGVRFIMTIPRKNQ